MDGVLGVDKPRGPTSHDIVQAARRVLRMRRIGHAGTLDPDASGVLLLCLGRATRGSRFLAEGQKEYRATLRLGFRTNTGDRTGRPVEAPRSVRVGLDRILTACRKWIGEVDQVPPMVSAVKQGGVRLYTLARAGLDVERQPRRVRIDAVDVETYAPPFLTVRVRCGSGTYIRSLAEDIGEDVGCGAHVFALRRTRVGRIGLERCVRWTDGIRTDADGLLRRMLTVDDALGFLPRIDMDERDTRRIRTGLPIRSREAPEDRVPAVRLRDPEGRLVAVGSADAADPDGERRVRPVWVLHPAE